MSMLLHRQILSIAAASTACPTCSINVCVCLFSLSITSSLSANCCSSISYLLTISRSCSVLFRAGLYAVAGAPAVVLPAPASVPQPLSTARSVPAGHSPNLRFLRHLPWCFDGLDKRVFEIFVHLKRQGDLIILFHCHFWIEVKVLHEVYSSVRATCACVPSQL